MHDRFSVMYPQQEGMAFIYDSFGIMPSVVARNPNLSFGAKAVYAYLSTYVNSELAKRGCVKAWPSRERMMYEMGMSVNTLTKYIRELKENGLIEVEQMRESSQDGKTVYSNNAYVLQLYVPVPSQYHNNYDTESESSEPLSVTDFVTLKSCDAQNLNPSNTRSFSNTRSLSINTYVQSDQAAALDDEAESTSHPVDSDESTSVSLQVSESESEKGESPTNQANGDAVASAAFLPDNPENTPKARSLKAKTVERLRQLSRNDYPDDFEQFWQHYPRKEAKAEAFAAWQAAREAGLSDVQLIDAARSYADEVTRLGLEKRYIKLCAGWITEGRVADYIRQNEERALREAAASSFGSLQSDAAVQYRSFFPPLESEVEQAVETPVGDVEHELKERLDEYEKQLRGIRMYSESDIQEMLVEHERLLRARFKARRGI
jgi:hypothetical protein